MVVDFFGIARWIDAFIPYSILDLGVINLHLLFHSEIKWLDHLPATYYTDQITGTKLLVHLIDKDQCQTRKINISGQYFAQLATGQLKHNKIQ